MRTSSCIIAGLVAGSCVLLQAGSRAATAFQPVIEVEQDVYRYEPADNGAGPMWCHGSTCLARVGDEVFATGLETLTNTPPLNNCRWTLWRGEQSGWHRVLADSAGRTREPSPLAVFPKSRDIFLSANPTLVPLGAAGGGPARPEVLRFRLPDVTRPAEVSSPGWAGAPKFTEHSYRSFTADGPGRELILFQNIGYTHAEWAFRDRAGKWSAQGQLKWPWGAEYDKPGPIRVCYPNVALSRRTVHFVGVSDIVEPYEQWRAYKRQLTGREWDYDFRRLFYTWSDDVRTGKFHGWLELASRDKTCGWISPGDLWAAPDGQVHIVWTERALDERLRARFFPDARQRHELNYALLRQGQVIRRQTLLAADEGGANEIAASPRFQVTPDHRLFVFFYVSGTDRAGRGFSENRLLEIPRAGEIGQASKVPLRFPLTSYFTATVRGGSAPSRTLDLLGTRAGSTATISYARLRL
jgi:hypothetical protein